MMLRYCVGFAVALGLLAVYARADDVFVRGQDKAIACLVKSETAKEIQVAENKTKKTLTIPGADVVDVLYDKIAPADLDLGGPYKLAKNAEKVLKDAGDPAKRRTAFKTALDGYTETLKKMEKDKSAPQAPRHFEYKIAVLTLQQATAEGLPIEKALLKLQTFKSKHPNSWQINQVMPMIAQLQLDNKDYKGAEETYQEMADMTDLPEEIRRDAELMAVQVSVRAGSLDQANKKLDTLTKKAAGNPAFASRVKMAKAEVLVGQKKNAEAEKLLHEVIKDNNDPKTKALAHNTLGESLFKSNRYNDALWEFLWVDAVYNQDKNQRAKALYYLWQTFTQLNNGERADECRQMLLDDPQFTGTEYQRLALTKTK